MAKRQYIVGIGELFWEHLAGGRRLCGSPATFAYHISCQGWKGVAAAAVGNDDAGADAIAEMKRLGIDTSYIQQTAAATGVMDWCEEKGYGLDVGVAKVPIVPAAVLFDLGVGSAKVRPDAAAGYAACEAASEEAMPQGRVGAGTGCTVGKALGGQFAMACGIGSASITLPSGVKVAAAVAVNALGDIFDHQSNQQLAGARDAQGNWLNISQMILGGAPSQSLLGSNTTIGIVATDAALTKAQANRLASVAHDGYALTIRPVHTMNDGDTLFALSCGEKTEDMTVLCAAAVEAVARAIVNAAQESQS